MFEIAMKMIFCLLIAALIGAIIGFLIGRILKCENRDSNEIKPFDKTEDNKNDDLPKNMLLESKAQEVEVEKVVEDEESEKESNKEVNTLLNIVKQESGIEIKESNEPNFLDAPRDGKPDDLKEISGIGLKLEKVLNDLGIYHFEQIASWGEKELNWIDENIGAFKGRAKRENWVEQAKILAKGGMTEFSKKVKNGEIDRY
jgi:predicted flap endonuclease-1-like 5' DNA nuclease